MLLSQLCDEPFIFVRRSSTQLVIEMNYGKNNANFLAQLQQQTKQRDRVRPARNGDPDAITRFQELVLPNIFKYRLRQSLHGNIVQPRAVWDGSTNVPESASVLRSLQQPVDS